MEPNSGLKSSGNASIKEWMCRLLFTLNAYLVLSGLLTYIQASYQLFSPLIPRRIIDQIAGPFMFGSLAVAFLLIPSLWFYFYRKRTVVIVIQMASVIAFSVFEYLAANK